MVRLRLEDIVRGVRKVLIYVRKPDKEEYAHMLKITLLGLAIAGSIGLVISIALGYLVQLR
ncbi:MAG: protein translocase SEC61 complex subunit gamma [Thermoprotei archaeon]|nr:MAG: protein translocase SEC61 complex subunit gamma [Thermoprotei archaeon]